MGFLLRETAKPTNRDPIIKDAERYKTVMCNKWEATGSCVYGHKCQFAHGAVELRPRVRVCRRVRKEFDNAPKRWEHIYREDQTVHAASKAAPPAPPAPKKQLSFPPGLARPTQSASAPAVVTPSPVINASTLLAFGPVDAQAGAAAETGSGAGTGSGDQLARFAMACLESDLDSSVGEAAERRKPPKRAGSFASLRRAVSFLWKDEPESDEIHVTKPIPMMSPMKNLRSVEASSNSSLQAGSKSVSFHFAEPGQRTSIVPSEADTELDNETFGEQGTDAPLEEPKRQPGLPRREGSFGRLPAFFRTPSLKKMPSLGRIGRMVSLEKLPSFRERSKR